MSDTIPSEAERLLTGEPETAHLATCVDGRPHVAPLWFHYDDGVVELVTSGRKLENLRANPKVSLAVERSTDGIPAWTVTLFGTATVVDDAAATREANHRINRRYGVPEDAWEDENTLVRIDVGSASYWTY